MYRCGKLGAGVCLRWNIQAARFDAGNSSFAIAYTNLSCDWIDIFSSITCHLFRIKYKSAFRFHFQTKTEGSSFFYINRRAYKGKLNGVCDFFCGFEELVDIIRSVAVERRYADCAFKSQRFHDSLGVWACIQPLEYCDAVL